MSDDAKIFLMVVVLACLVSLALFSGRVSQNDIAKCKAATNYSAERCMHEIMR